MEAGPLSQVLAFTAETVLRAEFKLMDNHQDAPGYILFHQCDGDNQPTGKYIAYLTYKPTEDCTVPLIHAFQLTSDMDAEGVTLAVQEAQDKFWADIKEIERIARAAPVPVQGENREPALWTGTSLKHFGQNPYGQDIWRVVWAPSRLYLVGGRWTDRQDGKIVGTVDEYRWIPKYDEERGWVLEKWLSAFEYAGSKLDWDMDNKDPVTGLEELGPYPSRGEYESAWKFPTYPNASDVERKIQMLIRGKEKYNQAQRAQAHREVLEGKKKDSDSKLEAMIRDAMPAFPLSAISGSPHRSGLGVNKQPIAVKDVPGFKQVN